MKPGLEAYGVHSLVKTKYLYSSSVVWCQYRTRTLRGIFWSRSPTISTKLYKDYIIRMNKSLLTLLPVAAFCGFNWPNLRAENSNSIGAVE